MKLKLALAALWMAFIASSVCAQEPAPAPHGVICTDIFNGSHCQYRT